MGGGEDRVDAKFTWLTTETSGADNNRRDLTHQPLLILTHAYSPYISTCAHPCQLTPTRTHLLMMIPPTHTQVLAAHADAVRVLVAIDNTRLVSGGDDGNLHVWSIAQAHLMRTLTGHKSRVTCATPLRGGRLASAATDRTVRLWDPHLGECIMVRAAGT